MIQTGLFKTKMLTLSAIISSLTLVGCGGSNSSTDTGTGGGTGLTGTTVSGQVADGYLNEATVCLDVNLNKVCDADEPSTTSGVDADGNPGSYTLEIPDTITDPSIYPVVVEIVAGVTIDMDSPDAPVTTSSTLSAPPGKPEFVSPLTTLVHSKIEANPTLSVDDAAQAVVSDLGFDASAGVDLFENYVEEQGENAKDPTKRDLYKQIHNVGRVVTAIMGNQNASNSDSFESEDDRFALQLVMLEKISQQLSQIITLLSDTTNLDEDGKINSDFLDFSDDTASNPFKDQIHDNINISADELVQKKTLIDNLENIAQADMETLLKGDGVYFINEKDRRGEEEGAEFAYGNFKINPQTSVGTDTMFFWNGVEWESNTEEEMHDWLILTANGFVAASTLPETASTDAEGKLIFSRGGVPYEEITASQTPIAGKKINDFLAGFADEWLSRIPADATFAEGALAIRGVNKALRDEYELRVDNDCYEAEMQDDPDFNCNYLNATDGSEATALADIVYADLAAIESNIDQIQTRAYVGWDLEVALYNNGTGIGAAFLMWSQGSADGTTSGGREVVGTVDVEVRTVEGTEMYFIDYAEMDPDLLQMMHDGHDRANGLFFAVHDGAVRKGELYAAGGLEEDDDWVLNKASMDSILAAFDPNGDKFLTSIEELKTDVSAADLNTAGVFTSGIFGTEMEYDWDSETETESVEHFIFGITIEDMTSFFELTEVGEYYDPSAQAWVEESEDDTETDRDLIYASGNWLQRDGVPEIVRFDGDDLVLTYDGGIDLERVSFTEVDLSNKYVRDFGPFMGEFAMSIDREAKFAEGDKGYFIHIQPIGTLYELHDHHDGPACDGSESICNFVYEYDESTNQDNAIATISELDGTGVRIYIDWGLYATIDTTAGTASIYEDYGFGEGEPVLKTTVDLVTDGDITKIPVPNEWHDGAFITEYDGYVRVGHYRDAASSDGNYEFLLDAEAIQTVKDNFVPAPVAAPVAE